MLKEEQQALEAFYICLKDEIFTIEHNAQLVEQILEPIDIVKEMGWEDPGSAEGLLAQTDNGHVYISMMLISWDFDWETKQKTSVREIRQQQVFMGERQHLLPESRAIACLTAWKRVMEIALLHDNDSLWMPVDFKFYDVLQLVSAKTQADFEKAYCKPSRFGKWVTYDQRPVFNTSTE